MQISTCWTGVWSTGHSKFAPEVGSSAHFSAMSWSRIVWPFISLLRLLHHRSIEAELRAHRDLISQEVEASSGLLFLFPAFLLGEPSKFLNPTRYHEPDICERRDVGSKMHCRPNGVVQKLKPRLGVHDAYTCHGHVEGSVFEFI